MWVLLLLLIRISSVFPSLIDVKKALKRALMWNQSINIFNSQFTPLMLSSLINLSDMRFKGDIASVISSYFSIVIIIGSIGSVVAIVLRLIKLSRNINEETVKEFNKKYLPLISDLKDISLSRVVIYWKVLNLIRLLITLTILTALNSYPAL
jgi:hypothetical protein